MWLKYFKVFIVIIVFIRLILIMTGDITIQKKISQSINWLVGVVLLFMSWSIIKIIFPSIEIGNMQGSIEAKDKIELEKQKEITRKNDGDGSGEVTIKVIYKKDKK